MRAMNIKERKHQRGHINLKKHVIIYTMKIKRRSIDRTVKHRIIIYTFIHRYYIRNITFEINKRIDSIFLGNILELVISELSL